ncbi:MAG: FAD-dependent oxidoreductase [Proteobacteria bacterium]|nr:FAD-dependent oxidoreductase [Pseudomonadota bacterium]
MLNEYVVIGGGPSGIVAVVRILEKLISISSDLTETKKLAKKIVWIDPKFAVGAFGGAWRNVPGNTPANKYQSVYKEMYLVLKAYDVAPPASPFQLDFEEPQYPTLLKTAAQPLQWVTKQLLELVTALQGKVEKITHSSESLNIVVNINENIKQVTTKRCILAIGGAPKTLSLPAHYANKLISLETALDLVLLKQYVTSHSEILTAPVLVQGSSHSAALAVWNLLECGAQVTQIMNKPYAYYENHQHDNDGLKGKVAEFTRKLVTGEIYTGYWSHSIIADGKIEDYSAFSGVIAAIGFQPVDTLIVNRNIRSSQIRYDLYNTKTEVPGLFAIGVGYPPAAPDGSKNVGISKFWPDIGKAVAIWHENPVQLAALIR